MPDDRASLAKFLDELVGAAVESPDDVPKVYRDVCLDLFSFMSPEQMRRVVVQLAKNYHRTAPVLDFEDDDDIPF